MNIYFNEQEAPSDRLEGEDYEIVEAPMATHDGSSISAQVSPMNSEQSYCEASVDMALVSLLLRHRSQQYSS